MPKYYEDLTQEQKKLHDDLWSEIRKREDGNITPILGEIEEKGLLKEVLTANVTKEVSFDTESVKCTLTPLIYAIGVGNQKGIKAILDVAKEKGLLKEILTANVTKEISFVDMKSVKYTLTPLAYAIDVGNQEGIKAILDVANRERTVKKSS